MVKQPEAPRYSAEWLIENCDPESAFERAAAKEMRRLLAENYKLNAQLDAARKWDAVRLDRINELEEQLYAIGAGGVAGGLK